jgi:hypothetical protein
MLLHMIVCSALGGDLYFILQAIELVRSLVGARAGRSVNVVKDRIDQLLVSHAQ